MKKSEWKIVSEEHIGNFRIFDIKQLKAVSPRTGNQHPYYLLDSTDWVNIIPITKENVGHPDNFIFQEGRSVFKFAVTKMADVSAEIMERNNLTGEDVDWLVPHQANLRIIDATANRMGLTKDKVMINIEKYGNTTSGTIPLCLWEWEKKLKKGDNIVLAAFGGGFTWGSVYLKWAY